MALLGRKELCSVSSSTYQLKRIFFNSWSNRQDFTKEKELKKTITTKQSLILQTADRSVFKDRISTDRKSEEAFHSTCKIRLNWGYSATMLPTMTSWTSTYARDWTDLDCAQAPQCKGRFLLSQNMVTGTPTYLVELKRVLLTLVVKFKMAFSGFGWVWCRYWPS